MLTNILRHSVCLARRPSRAAFFVAGIRREIPLLVFRAEIVVFRLLYSVN
jgi:hypothetical protein